MADDERILARRITLDEFRSSMGKLEYFNGRIVTGPGIELFVGIKEFAESLRALEEERRRALKDGRPSPAPMPDGTASK